MRLKVKNHQSRNKNQTNIQENNQEAQKGDNN